MIGCDEKWSGILSRVRPDDLIAEYLSKGSNSFVAIMRATSYAYEDDTPFWEYGAYRFRVDEELMLVTPDESHGVPGKQLAQQLEFVARKRHWGVYFQVKIREISKHDFDAIENALQVAGGTSSPPGRRRLERERIVPTAAQEKSIPQPPYEPAPTHSRIYAFYRQRDFSDHEARLMEIAHKFTQASQTPDRGVLDTQLAMDFLLNGLTATEPPS